jgi:hypothetical protein
MIVIMTECEFKSRHISKDETIVTINKLWKENHDGMKSIWKQSKVTQRF